MTSHLALRSLRLLAFCLGSVAAWSAAESRGDEGEQYWNPCRQACEECRAGFPFCIKRLAAPSNTRHYCGYYVGGGNAFCAGGPRPIDEGTWGWDYYGLLKHNRIVLGWNYGNRYQGGTGQYKTDPRPAHIPLRSE